MYEFMVYEDGSIYIASIALALSITCDVKLNQQICTYFKCFCSQLAVLVHNNILVVKNKT